MSGSFATKIVLLGSLSLVVGFSGCGGGADTAQPTAGSIQDDAKSAQQRADFVKEQYKNKMANPSK
jgi:hypothetical protein